MSAVCQSMCILRVSISDHPPPQLSLKELSSVTMVMSTLGLSWPQSPSQQPKTGAGSTHFGLSTKTRRHGFRSECGGRVVSVLKGCGGVWFTRIWS